MSKEGITYYYKNLPRGEKDGFVREVAEALEYSASNISVKLRTEKWTRIEAQEIERIIERRKAAKVPAERG